ncbi:MULTISPECIES: hypothetical protein [Crateriforma]|uniref:Uncharacterized protein n=1 Tax=Crateriforma conspicua TaxID=2527996 RepID=A0A5C6FMT5_9PLAN|nr:MULTISPECIES: hypothetical protein [Crateriforma]TWU63367.1 hypothetical protein V7x_51070 [Crateriforma conspicua]
MKPTQDHVVSRLKWRIQDATQMGFHVRTEPLDGRGADWCQLGRRRILFLDMTQTAADQLEQLDQILAEFRSPTEEPNGDTSAHPAVSMARVSAKAA